jgi:hypothetical protein
LGGEYLEVNIDSSSGEQNLLGSYLDVVVDINRVV